MSVSSEANATSTELLDLQHVSRFYGTVIGIGDVSLKLEPGAYGLIGPNGAGKTTLLNVVTGMLSPCLGSVRVFGHDPQKQRSVLRRIGRCPASDILIPNVSGFEWVSFQTALHGFPRAEAEHRTEKAMERVGLTESMHRAISSYSLGMRQRAKLAQAISHDPDLLILDEPFNGLDPIGRHELTDFLRQWSASGKSLMLASHILHEVEAVTTSFLLIHGGRILATGNAREVGSMLSGFPVEVRIAGSGLQQMVAELVTKDWFDSCRFDSDYRSLRLSVSDSSQLLDELKRQALRPEVTIESLESPDGTLEAAFELLLKVHRGELTAASVN
jgi:ABC-2 type transport system ATP-binding protein